MKHCQSCLHAFLVWVLWDWHPVLESQNQYGLLTKSTFSPLKMCKLVLWDFGRLFTWFLRHDVPPNKKRYQKDEVSTYCFCWLLLSDQWSMYLSESCWRKWNEVIPIGSMYCVFSYGWLLFMVNVGICIYIPYTDRMGYYSLIPQCVFLEVWEYLPRFRRPPVITGSCYMPHLTCGPQFT